MAENIKKQIENVNRQERSLRILREQFLCDCDHKRNGEFDAVPVKDRKQGELKYICGKCKKIVDLSKLTDEELTSHCDGVDRACDLIKLSLDPQKEEDRKVLKRVSKVQFRVRNEIKPLYAAALKKNRTGGRRRNKNDQDSSWGKPVMR